MKRKCFVITPIGAAGSPERIHADTVWESALQPVFEPEGYELIPSDKMNDPGQITKAIFECIRDSDVCVADLSFLNPNVMYELAVRHCFRLPVIQIKSEGTRLPFDNHNQRTIEFDPQSDESFAALRAEIKAQLNWIERNPGTVSNPITVALGNVPQNLHIDQLVKEIQTLRRRVDAIEVSANPEVAAAIVGQGELATKNLKDIMSAIKAEIQANSIHWKNNDDGSVMGQFKGFNITLRPQSKGRWSSSAVHSVSGHSVSYPTWRNSRDEAKSAILRAMLEEIQHIEN